MNPKIYLETTIPSYLTSRPSRDLVMAAHQQITREWWDTQRDAFDLFVSQMVLDEVSSGDPEAAARRLGLLKPLPLLNPHDEEAELAQALLKQAALPARAAAMRSILPSPSSTGWITSSRGIVPILPMLRCAIASKRSAAVKVLRFRLSVRLKNYWRGKNHVYRQHCGRSAASSRSLCEEIQL